MNEQRVERANRNVEFGSRPFQEWVPMLRL